MLETRHACLPCEKKSVHCIWFPFNAVSEPTLFPFNTASEVLYDARNQGMGSGDPYEGLYLVSIWHQPNKCVKYYTCGRIAKYTICMGVTVPDRGHDVICHNCVEFPHHSSLHRVLHYRTGFRKYSKQAGHGALHFIDAEIVVLTVMYVTGMEGLAMFALFATSHALFQFLVVLCLPGYIISKHRKIFILGVFRRFAMWNKSVERSRCYNFLLLQTSARISSKFDAVYVRFVILKCMEQKLDRAEMSTSVSRIARLRCRMWK